MRYRGERDQAEIDRICRTDLYKLGDTILAWVNEGDIIMFGKNMEPADEIERLRGQRERMWCKSCGTVTRDARCDCTRTGSGTQRLVSRSDALRADLLACSDKIELLREAIVEFLAAEDEVEAEARRAEANGGLGWSTAPTARRIYAVKALRELVAEAAPTPPAPRPAA
jgi:hypothetical protein